MKSEKIYDALNGLRDDQILAGEKPLARKRPKYLRWAAPLAAVLALVILAGAVGLPMLHREPTAPATEPNSTTAAGPRESQAGVTEPQPTGSVRPTGAAPDSESSGAPDLRRFSLARPNYPKMAPYPRSSDFWNPADESFDMAGYEASLNAWMESRDSLHGDKTYARGLEAYLGRAIPAFLSGAEGENRVCSPLNVWMALAMLAETTDGNSRQELLDLLGMDSVEAVRAAAKTLWECNYCDDGLLTSILANSLWLRENTNYDPAALETLARDYYASSFSGQMGTEEYDKAIRAWVNEQTGGLLKDQAEGIGTDPLTVLVLLSTIWYKTSWEEPFSDSFNETGPFHGPAGDENVTYLCQTLEEENAWLGEHFTAAGKRLNGGGTMYFLLPKEGISPESLLTDPEAMAMIGSRQGREGLNHKLCDVSLKVPKFDVSSDLDLVEPLKNLGIRDVFDDQRSDFTPLTTDVDDLYVSTIRHAARVRIDEDGCEAAAFTEIDVEMAAEPMPLEKLELTLDRPFLFVIANNEGLPLFLGTVNHPAQ